ncbi:MAG: glycosyltransferase family 9 protein [Bacteroidota bacterium]
MASPVNEEIMLRNKSLDEVLVFKKERYLRSRGLRIGNALRDLREIRSRKYELAVVPSTVSTSLTSDSLAYLSGARFRIGARSLDGEKNPSGFLFTQPVDLDWRDTPERHQTLRNADILGSHTDPPGDLSHEITLTEEEERWGRNQVDEWQGGMRKAIALHPGAGKEPNRWPPERFAEVAERLSREFEALVLITAGPMDGEEVGIVENTSSVNVQVIKNEPIRRVASILKYVDLVISNDTGIMHVAAGVGTPVLSLFGPTDPRQWAPLGEIHRYIKSETSDIGEIAVSHVLRIAREMLRAPAEGGHRT